MIQGSDSEPEESPAALVGRIRGGGSPPQGSPASPRKQSDFVPLTSSAMGFHPIPGVIRYSREEDKDFVLLFPAQLKVVLPKNILLMKLKM